MSARKNLISTLEITLELLKDPDTESSDPLCNLTIDMLALMRLRDQFNNTIVRLQSQLEQQAIDLN